MIGHLGNKVGALVDGQIPHLEAERLWEHVMSCEPCHAAVEREGWVKTRLAGLRHDPRQPEAPNYLHAVLCEPPPPLGGSSSNFDPARSGAARRRTMTVAVLGAGSVGAAVVGVLALTVPTQPPLGDRRGPATSLTRTTEAPATARPVSATGGSVSAPLSSVSDRTPPAPAGGLLPAWVRITK